MMILEENIARIAAVAERKMDENYAFRVFLEGQDAPFIDELVHRLNDEITPRIDCTTCGNCCQNLRPIASEKVLLQFVDASEIESVMYEKSIQCKHQVDKKCTKYEERYEDCRTFPYMDREGFVSRIVGVLQNYEICPIVFNIVEQLKVELNWVYKQ